MGLHINSKCPPMFTYNPQAVFPGALDFYLEDQTTHKRVLTIYNPFDVDIFEVLCNNPEMYAVLGPEGRILGCRIVMTLWFDKSVFHICDEGSTEVAGKRVGAPDPGDSKHGSSLRHRPAAALEQSHRLVA